MTQPPSCVAGTQRLGGLTEAQLAEELSGTRNLGLPQVSPSRRHSHYHEVCRVVSGHRCIETAEEVPLSSATSPRVHDPDFGVPIYPEEKLTLLFSIILQKKFFSYTSG